jgi:hypothetical protein
MSGIARGAAAVTEIVIGWALLVAGLVMLVTPGPGIVTVIAGLAVLARHYRWAARVRERVRVRAADLRQRSTRPGSSPEADVPGRAPTPRLRSNLEDSVSGGRVTVGRRVAVTSAQRAGATMTSTSPTPSPTRRATTSRAVLAVVLAGLVVLAVVFWVFARQGGPAQPDGDGRLEIVMDDYEFEPADLALPTDVPLELVFVNRDDTVHHVSFGRNVMVEDGAEVGFAEDLFAGTSARFDPPRARVGPSEQFPTLSVRVDPGSTATLYVTVPEDREGDWMFGCFTARGCQFRAGLAGTITVE